MRRRKLVRHYVDPLFFFHSDLKGFKESNPAHYAMDRVNKAVDIAKALKSRLLTRPKEAKMLSIEQIISLARCNQILSINDQSIIRSRP